MQVTLTNEPGGRAVTLYVDPRPGDNGDAPRHVLSRWQKRKCREHLGSPYVGGNGILGERGVQHPPELPDVEVRVGHDGDSVWLEFHERDQPT